MESQHLCLPIHLRGSHMNDKANPVRLEERMRFFPPADHPALDAQVPAPRSRHPQGLQQRAVAQQDGSGRRGRQDLQLFRDRLHHRHRLPEPAGTVGPTRLARRRLGLRAALTPFGVFPPSADHQTKDRPEPLRQRFPGLRQKQVRPCPCWIYFDTGVVS